MTGDEIRIARRAMGLKQEELAERAGLSRKTVQRIERSAIDPRLSTVTLIARALGMELLLIPAALRPALEGFVRAGGKLAGQPPGVDAPPSIVEVLAKGERARR